MSASRRLALALAVLLLACFDGGIDEASVRITSLHASLVACGADDRGTMRCWGGVRAPLGQADQAVPAVVPRGGHPRLVTIQDRGGHGCGLDADGRAWCWGDNYWGQVGIGRNSGQEPPSLVATELRFSAIGVFYNTSCGLATDRMVYCWGDVDQAGRPVGAPDTCTSDDSRTYSCLLAPRPVNSPERFTSFSGGYLYACALAQGTPHCWSWDEAPTPLAEVPALTTVRAAGSLACGLSTDSIVICWRSYDPSPAVVSFPPGVTPTDLTASSEHACVLDQDGAAWCWGRGLGVGTASISGSPTPVEVIGGLRFSTLAAGEGFTCGVRVDGAWCWGAQVGDGSGIPSAVPVRVAGQGSADD